MEPSITGDKSSQLDLPCKAVTDIDDSVDKGIGPWMIVERRRRPSKSSSLEGGRLSRRMEQVKPGDKKSILGPFRFSGSIGVGQKSSRLAERRDVVHKNGMPSNEKQKICLGSFHAPLSIMPKVDVGTSVPSMNSVLENTDVEPSVPAMESLLKDIDCHAFSGFLSQTRGSAGRLSWAKFQTRGDRIRGAKKEKMKNDLGPITFGSRKRRKSYSSTDGGDGSPTRPP